MRDRKTFGWILAAGIVSLALSFPAAQEGDDIRAAQGAITIGVEDVLEVIVRDRDEVSRTVTVRPDGKITLPFINDVYVRGMTPEGVRAAITERLTDFFQDPYVTVIVEQYNSFKIYFLGEVNQQGPLILGSPTRLLQALSAVGGVTEFSKREAVIVRESSGVQERIEIDLKKLLQGKDFSQNIYLRSGDTILVQ